GRASGPRSGQAHHDGQGDSVRRAIGGFIGRAPDCRVAWAPIGARHLGRVVQRAMRAISFLLPAIAVTVSTAGLAADQHPASLVGVYDGGQMEIAAGLKLGKDGQFQYGLSYGALDEMAA